MRKYFQQTKTLAFSLVAISPLLFIYEFNISRYNEGRFLEVRNAAEVYIKKFFGFFGLETHWHLGLIYALATLAVILYARHRKEPFPKVGYWFGFLIETVVYAAVFGTIARHITQFLVSLQMSRGMSSAEFGLQALLAIAAGVYEELLFRFFLAGSLLLIFKTVLPAKIGIQAILAALISALLFSLFHYPSMELVYWNSFVFRMVAGFILGMLYIYRGLGVAVYTHALYDLFFLYRML